MLIWIDSWQCLLLNCMKKIASVGRGTWKKWEKWKGQTKKVVRMVEMHVGGHQRRPCGGRPEKLAPIRADHAAAPSSMYKYMYWAFMNAMICIQPSSVYSSRARPSPPPANNNFFMQGRCCRLQRENSSNTHRTADPPFCRLFSASRQIPFFAALDLFQRDSMSYYGLMPVSSGWY